MKHLHVDLLFCVNFDALFSTFFAQVTKFLLHTVLWHFKDIRLEQKSLVPDVFTNYQHSEQHNSKTVSHKNYSSSILFQYSLFADISYFSQKIIQKHKAL